jgi:hypothetical protein
LIEFNARLLVYVSDEATRPDGAINLVLGAAYSRIRLERDSVGCISNSRIEPSEAIEDMISLFLGDTDRKMFGEQ